MTPTRSTRTPGPPTRASSAGALGRCVEPCAAETFLAEYWEKRPLAVERDGRARFHDLLSEADVEALVCSSALRHPALRLVKAGEQIALADYTTDIPWRPAPFARVADPDAVARAFADGATVVLQGLHHWWPPLAHFTRALEGELGHPAQTNAYWTPRRSQGLPVHHDTHDVFVLQVAGEKRWLVYEPRWRLPLKEQRYKPEMGPPGEAVHDVVLGPGDTLYLPRGWLHEAVTSRSDSLHLTVGVNIYTWADAFRAALAACEEDVRFRRSVPDAGEGGGDLLDALAERLAPDRVARRMRTRFLASRRPIRDGQITQLRALSSLTGASLLERRRTVVADLTQGADGRVSLVFEGKTVSFPPQAREEVEAVFASDGPFRPRELPGALDGEGRLVLVRRLVREGFLRISEPGAEPSRGNGAGTPEPRTST